MREKGIHLVETHVAGACIGNGLGPIYVLALRRAGSRSLYPNLWEGIGGQVQPGQSFEDAVRSHLQDEAGISGRVVCPFATYVIQPGPDTGAEHAIPGVRFLVKIDGTPQPRIREDQHQGWAWLPEDEIDKVEWIPGIKDQLVDGIKLYKRLHYEDSV